MNLISNFKQSLHFKQRISQRQIDPFLVSMCLIKGSIKTMKRNKIEFTLSKKNINQAIKQGYILAKDCFGLTSLTVVARENTLITAFVRFSDIGITN
ncbi:hypothetical protein [Tenacibaculum finnmarkense]|uniref:hypothetical protein n=2 Tax=Tenacibaculum finnmarkense TaxID=2781243 RepID=UPI001E30443A|nr:hypothetical protein [Tenacibaculum finnmarkense]MCD8413679.1 hypothetical protein [Tenacibaculum finnmarkense genomovar ulcerans]MCD8446764.1 hypothetical protein [Tenacibaculum finnmarkense genomovar finnmarkense]MCG8208364.1 hypothetical protein [Tenacibaculum finnmarkense genomovar finnmarkense]MCG8724324.1 hypothetical protein [Tenacibaculum finnmarkense]MCG8742643.1 hypothetical protein [Tenacibaculum finnmarkense]